MDLTFLWSKLHRATVTEALKDYEGSCAIDEDLLDAAKMREFQQIDIWNVDNGERFSTYAIKAPRGSRTISVNGAAARKVAVGDRVIIATYATLNWQEQGHTHHPTVVLLNDDNTVKEIIIK